jgi:DNA repair protein RadC
MIVSEKKKSVCTPVQTADIMRSILAAEDESDQKKEHMWTISVNTKNVIQYISLESLGSLTASICHPREIFKLAIIRSTAAIILCHNHPSGDPKPSHEDILLTRRLVQAGEVLGIQILDHVIIGTTGQQFSFRENGLIAKE